MSFYDSANLGDLLIAKSLHDFASGFGPADRLSYSGDPFHFADPEALPTRPPGPAGPPGMRARLVATRVGHAAWRVREPRSARHARIRDTITRSDLLLLGGGNMIFDLEAWTRSSGRFEYFVDTARQSGVPVFGISLGIGPFASTRQHKDACRVLDRCGWLSFRDQISLDLYFEHGTGPAGIGVDPVLLMPQAFDRPENTSNRIAWNLVEPRLVGGLDDSKRQEILREHASAIKRLVLDGWSVVLFSTDRADEPFLEEVEAIVRSPKCRFRRISGLSSLLDVYSMVDIVVASRMHALIVAFTQGTPVIGLSWQQKVRAFFELIERADQCVSLLELDMKRLQELIGDAREDPKGFAIDETDRARLHGLNELNRRVMAELRSVSR
ncbi:MAG: polysaccharide pyruvyl transferase family protein [Nocardioides sp.]